MKWSHIWDQRSASIRAGVAQKVEQSIRNQRPGTATPTAGSNLSNTLYDVLGNKIGLESVRATCKSNHKVSACIINRDDGSGPSRGPSESAHVGRMTAHGFLFTFRERANLVNKSGKS